jgi:hypothetical protein
MCSNLKNMKKCAEFEVVMMTKMPIPVVVRSKAWVFGRSLTRIVGLNSTGGHGCLSLVSVVCCQAEVSATSWSLVQRSPTECGVSQMCVIMKPRRNEEAQAHIGLSSHLKKMMTKIMSKQLSRNTLLI